MSIALENFFKLRAEKQDHIINAAFKVFGRQGYRKASIGDIALEGGTTKGMITYYFGSKKTLYFYLMEVSHIRLVRAVEDRITPDITDFFEKLKIITGIQVAALKEYPALISFMTSLYYETDPEVAEDIAQGFIAEQAHYDNMLMGGTDFTQLKSDVDPQLICKFVSWTTEGFLEALLNAGSPDKVDALVADFYQCLDLTQKTFYRETI
ncbi:MAG: TetR/AcrR family transcriptional regulator [Oscillospiraceae bacterium]|nr:TetR/AcrR family transcriptional regulator [Oscillospiraceae bacterium]